MQTQYLRQKGQDAPPASDDAVADKRAKRLGLVRHGAPRGGLQPRKQRLYAALEPPPGRRRGERKPEGKCNKGEKDDPDFFESAGSEESPAESADLNSNEDGRGAEDAAKETAALVDEILPDPQSTFLLDNVPESKRRKPGKKDTAITVNALIGIGNKPYLRGSGAGLSPSEGLPMEYVEIGKWRYVLPEISAPVEFRVLKNDKENSDGDETFTIKPGEKLELNLSFPLE